MPESQEVRVRSRGSGCFGTTGTLSVEYATVWCLTKTVFFVLFPVRLGGPLRRVHGRAGGRLGPLLPRLLISMTLAVGSQLLYYWYSPRVQYGKLHSSNNYVNSDYCDDATK